MKGIVLSLVALLVAGCAISGPIRPQYLSGEVRETKPVADGLLIGLMADSQLQTQKNDSNVFVYRSKLADWATRVAIRPPALDLSARAIIRSQLKTMRRRGVKAIFYLGDGANNGCEDELINGYLGHGTSNTDGDDDLGLLAILDNFRRGENEFRTEKDEPLIPVYFVLGNHDSLGAGSTGNERWRHRFCEDQSGGLNRALPKARVIAWVDRFNRDNSSIAPGWTYTSSFVESGTDKDVGTDERCGDKAFRQHRMWGCYLAAKVDTHAGKTPVQFLLLDTSDWADIKRLQIGPIELLGKWGGMSIGKPRTIGESDETVLSQIDWFAQNAGEPMPMRIALMHYNVLDLQKRVPVLGRLSRLTWRMADLFSIRGPLRSPRQQGGYLISAHTHTPHFDNQNQRFRVSRGEPRQDLFITELNIGSTTDSSNYSTIAELRPAAGPRGEMRYDRVVTEPSDCSGVKAEIARKNFSNAVGKDTLGWKALGVSEDDPNNYWRFKPEDRQAIRDNWRDFVMIVHGENRVVDDHRAACIGLEAARVENLSVRNLKR